MLRTLLRAGLVLLAFSTAASAEPIKVTLLGTGVPTPRPTSFSASTLVEAGNEKLLFDLGRGSTMQLYKLKIPLGPSPRISSRICIPTTSSAFPTCG